MLRNLPIALMAGLVGMWIPFLAWGGTAGWFIETTNLPTLLVCYVLAVILFTVCGGEK